jgi:hypothetical protein
MAGEPVSSWLTEMEVNSTVGREEAIILSAGRELAVERNLARVLAFFGIQGRTVDANQFINGNQNGEKSLRIFCSAGSFLKLREAHKSADQRRQWSANVHSAFIYADDSDANLQEAFRILTGDATATMQVVDPTAKEFAIAGEDFCGIMGGVRAEIPAGQAATIRGVRTQSEKFSPLIAVERQGTFWKFHYEGVLVFLCTSPHVIDLDAKFGPRNFDIRNHFMEAVPWVLYLKRAFPKSCWNATEINACLVIDDPLLKPQYGFVNFQKLLKLMERRNFSTNIAFIPWNWRRSNSKVVQLFQKNPDRFSLSVHGCDHTGSEFGTTDTGTLARKANQAVERMRRHAELTGLQHDPVMVFPQGVFSRAAMRVLKQKGFIAAVNSETQSIDAEEQTMPISAWWSGAITDYDSFPLFTRRYPSEGIENFAFDALLGKPCLIVIHHDYCHDRNRSLMNFIDRLNSLKRPLKWRSLGEVIRRSYRQRQLADGAIEVEMFGAELSLENDLNRARRFIVSRRESDPGTIRRIVAGLEEVAWTHAAGCIRFELEIPAGQTRRIAIEFHNYAAESRSFETSRYRVKTLIRRHLCEVRDNYVMPARSILGLLRPASPANPQEYNT